MKSNIKNPIYIISETNFQKLKLNKLEEIEQFLINQSNAMKELCIQKKTKSKADKIEAITLFYKDFCCIEVNKSPKKVAANLLSLITIGENLRYHFDNLHFEDLETVIIENQVSPIASRMKTIQGMVSQYFIMKDCYEQLKTIEFVSSQNKLKDFLKDGNTTTTKLTYKERKSKSVEVCLQLLKKNVEDVKFVDTFEKSTKKDDLADCFLQGYSYIQKKAF
jgi:hypothetical protein